MERNTVQLPRSLCAIVPGTVLLWRQFGRWLHFASQKAGPKSNATIISPAESEQMDASSKGTEGCRIPVPRFRPVFLDQEQSESAVTNLMSLRPKALIRL